MNLYWTSPIVARSGQAGSEQAGALPSQTPQAIPGSMPGEIPGQTPGGTPQNPSKHPPHNEKEALGREESKDPYTKNSQQNKNPMTAPQADPRETKGGAADTIAAVEEGVCANCGRSQEQWVEDGGRGIEKDGLFYCSEACAAKAPLSIDERS